MAWKRLDEVTKQVLARVVIAGETGIGVPSQPKRTASAKPAAKYTGQRPTEGEMVILETAANSGQEDDRVLLTTSRCMTTAVPTRMPRAAVVIHLHVIEGGARRREGETASGTFRSSTRGDASKLRLVVHAATDLSKTGVSMRPRNS